MAKKNLKHGVKKIEKTQLKSAVKAAGKSGSKSVTRAAAKNPAKVSSKTSGKVSPKASAKPAKLNAKAKKAAPPAKLDVRIKKNIAPLAAKAKVKTQEAKAPGPKLTETPKAKIVKSATEKASKKAPKVKKTEEVDLEDDFIPDDEIGGEDIGEYEDELKAVETLDIEVEEDLDWTAESKPASDEDIYLTDADGNRYCRAKDCDQISAVDGYCRFHYLLFWKRIQVRKKILADGKLEKYVEELTARYPDKFVEMIRRDLRTQKDFQAAIQELEIDESELNADNEEETQSYIDEVRGLGETTSMEEEEF